MANKRKVVLFVSYARANKTLAARLLDAYKEQVSASKRYEYDFWQDARILVGEEWHEAIRQALEYCHLGLILISPALLGSKYVTEHELPKFVGNAVKPFIPVMLQPVDFELMDLKGLEGHQIFRLDSERLRSPRAYADCTRPQRDRFVQALFRQVEQRLNKLF